jgi:hypothetical protein
MQKKKIHPDFAQILENLRANGFTTAPYADLAGGVLVARDGVGAVLLPGDHKDEVAARLAVAPGLLLRGELARLLDRGYQKFMKTSQDEQPATASQLQRIHVFGEELRQWIGAGALFNESLGTTSDRYQYDRVQRQKTATPVAAQA